MWYAPRPKLMHSTVMGPFSSTKIAYGLWLVLFAANSVDVGASFFAIEVGYLEANVLVREVYEKFGLTGLIIVKTFWLLVLLVLVPWMQGWTLALLAFASLIYVFVTIYHLVFLLPLICC